MTGTSNSIVVSIEVSQPSGILWLILSHETHMIIKSSAEAYNSVSGVWYKSLSKIFIKTIHANTN